MALPESCVRGSSRPPLFPGLSCFSRPGEYGRQPAARRRPMQPDRTRLRPGAGHRSHPSTTGRPDRIPTGQGPRNTRTDTPNPLVTSPFCRNPTGEPDTAAFSGIHPRDRIRRRRTARPATARLTPRHRRIANYTFRGRPDRSAMPTYDTVPSHGRLPARPIGRSGPPARPKSKNADT